MTTMKVLCCFAPEDKKLMEGLRAHLRILEIQNVSIWYTQSPFPGAEWEPINDRQLQSAHLILFLVSADFLNPHERYKKFVLPAMERHNKRETCVIPIILRPVHWQETPFGKLHPLPEDGKPVTDELHWKTLDHAFFNIVSGIKRVIDSEKLFQLAQQENDNDQPLDREKSTFDDTDVTTQLAQIIQGFQLLRSQIADAVYLKRSRGFSIENCRNQYNKLYGDTLVLLARYFPQAVSDDEEGFIETIYRRAAATLQQRSTVSVWLARWVIAPLAEIEKLAAQIDACVATLESYKQEHFL